MNNSEMTYSTDIGGSPSATLKSTLISIVPFEIHEFKPGLIPGQFDIAASLDGEPQCKLIGESIYYVFIDETRGSLKISDPSYKVAKSICDDYNSAQIVASLDAHPGLSWELGEWTPKQIKERFKNKLESMVHKQLNWFLELVKLADDDWEKTRHHYSISDTQRFAAKALDPTNSRQRPWIMVNPLDKPIIEVTATKTCPACGSDVPSTAVICRYCNHILDQAKYEKMSFATPGSVGGMDLSKIVKQ